ncbi:MAG: nitronate monooxygenase, partial [Acetivibrio sp.]
MEKKPLVIGEKIAKLPLIQGGMGVGISLSGLAGAVAKEGGIGILSSAQIGYREPDFDKNPMKANIRAIKSEYDKARKIAPHGIIGYNIMVALKHYEEYVKAAVEAGADLIISGAGIPAELPEYTKNSNTKIAPIVSTDKAARVILKYWDKKYNKTADLIVIEGPKAGGHLGFRKEQLDSFTEEAYDREILAILKTVKEYAGQYNKRIPVVVAGGIENAEQVKHVFSLGGDGVQVATRFITTEE